MNLEWKFYPAAEFHHFQDVWRAMNLPDTSSPILKPEFVIPLLQEFGTGREKLAICKQGQLTVAIAILVKKHFAAWETFQPAQAPIGLWLNEPSADMENLLRSLLNALPGYPMLIALTQRDPELWLRPIDATHIKTLDYVHTGFILLDEPFQNYWQSRDSQVRKSINRRLRQLAEQGIEPRLEVISDPAKVSGAIADFGRLESAGWKGKQGTAIHSDNSQGRFYTYVLHAFCMRGKGRIYRYWLGDSVAAMQLSIEEGSVTVFLKTTFDEQFSTSGPGILIKRAIIELLCETERINKIELYGKLRDYQEKWVSGSKLMYHVNYYRWAILPKLLSLARSVVWYRRQAPQDSDGRY